MSYTYYTARRFPHETNFGDLVAKTIVLCSLRVYIMTVDQDRFRADAARTCLRPVD